MFKIFKFKDIECLYISETLHEATKFQSQQISLYDLNINIPLGTDYKQQNFKQFYFVWRISD